MMPYPHQVAVMNIKVDSSRYNLKEHFQLNLKRRYRKHHRLSAALMSHNQFNTFSTFNGWLVCLLCSLTSTWTDLYFLRRSEAHSAESFLCCASQEKAVVVSFDCNSVLNGTFMPLLSFQNRSVNITCCSWQRYSLLNKVGAFVISACFKCY